jgi:hypothetical protein
MKIHAMETELFLVDRRTVGHDETNSFFSQFCKLASKITLRVKTTSVNPLLTRLRAFMKFSIGSIYGIFSNKCDFRDISLSDGYILHKVCT